MTTDSPPQLPPDELISRFLQVATTLRDAPSYEEDLLARALREAGLTICELPVDPRDADLGEAPARIRSRDEAHVALPATDDLAGFEKRLRRAMTRLLGRPGGGERLWDVGCGDLGLDMRLGQVRVVLRPHVSYAQLRAAAREWFDGADLQAWLIAHGFAPADVSPSDGIWDSPSRRPFHARVHATEGRVTVGFSLDPGARPPGDRSGSDDERYASTLAYLAEGLGYSEIEGFWYRGSRSFWIRRLKTRTRIIEFLEAPAGTVRGRASSWELSAVPDPDPEQAVPLLSGIAEQIGAAPTAAASALAAAGLVDFTPPEPTPRGIGLVDHRGHRLELLVADGRVAGGTVLCAGTRTRPEEVDALLCRQYGPIIDREHGRSQWHHGDLEVHAWHSSSFQRNRLEPRPARIQRRSPPAPGSERAPLAVPAQASSVMELRIAPCTAADLRRLLAGPVDPRSAAHHRERFALQESGAATYLLAWRGAENVGRATLYHRSKYAAVRARHPGTAEINALEATPPGQGIGSALIGAAEAIAARRGHDAVGLAVAPGNPGARRLYERLGYVPWGHGQVIDVWVEPRPGGDVEHRDPCDYLRMALPREDPAAAG